MNEPIYPAHVGVVDGIAAAHSIPNHHGRAVSHPLAGLELRIPRPLASPDA